jgi:hypothetical protein
VRGTGYARGRVVTELDGFYPVLQRWMRLERVGESMSKSKQERGEGRQTGAEVGGREPVSWRRCACGHARHLDGDGGRCYGVGVARQDGGTRVLCAACVSMGHTGDWGETWETPSATWRRS